MKVAVLMLSFERYDTLKRVLEHNLANAGCEFDLFIWDNGSKDERVLSMLRKTGGKVFSLVSNKGIAYPLNVMMLYAYNRGYEAFHVMANDILEPNNWLADKVKYLSAFGKSGMISICPGPIPYMPSYLSMDMPFYFGDVIGQFMISRQVYEQVGRFREDFGHYGPIDNDYNARCIAKGFVNYYIPGQSIHLGDDNPGYGYNKHQVVAATWPVHVQNTVKYAQDPDSAYLAPENNDYTINMDQFADD